MWHKPINGYESGVQGQLRQLLRSYCALGCTAGSHPTTSCIKTGYESCAQARLRQCTGHKLQATGARNRCCSLTCTPRLPPHHKLHQKERHAALPQKPHLAANTAVTEALEGEVVGATCGCRVDLWHRREKV